MKRITLKSLGASIEGALSEIRDMKIELEDLRTVARVASNAITDHAGRMAQIEHSLSQTREALGGHMWKTAQGHVRWIVDLSTEHLQNILRSQKQISGDLHVAINAELHRREIDQEYREGKRGPILPIPSLVLPPEDLTAYHERRINARQHPGACAWGFSNDQIRATDADIKAEVARQIEERRKASYGYQVKWSLIALITSPFAIVLSLVDTTRVLFGGERISAEHWWGAF